MQSLRKRAILLLCLFIPAGITIAFLPKPGAPRKSEAWLQSKAPHQMDGYQIMPYTEDPNNPSPSGADNSNISYRMDSKTYETLKAFGIVCQTYRGPSKAFDAVVITSDSHQSFHDPRICFQSQGWSLDKTEVDTIKTKTYGEVPVTIVEVNKDGSASLALFTYCGPNKVFRAAPLRMFRDMFFNQLRTGKVSVCFFYRIIALHPNATRDELKEFAGNYIDAANASSNGYF